MLRSLISPQANISILQKYLLDSLNHIHIWQVSPQLSSPVKYKRVFDNAEKNRKITEWRNSA